MHHLEATRRATLGLPISGPYARNRRRRSLREAVPGLIAAALLTGLAVFLIALFA